MKIYVHRTPAIMDGLVIRWNLGTEETREISASRNGVAISGHWMLYSSAQRAAFENILASAWNARESLGRGIEPARYENEVDVRFGETLAQVVARQEKP